MEIPGGEKGCNQKVAEKSETSSQAKRHANFSPSQ
jgi:hypothetical protein